MHTPNTLRRMITCIIFGAIVLVLGSLDALGQPSPPKDQEKLYFNSDSLYYVLYYTDANTNGWHDPGEQFFAGPGGNAWKRDNSCWMASAGNMLEYEEKPHPYTVWLGTGGALSPNNSPWDSVSKAGGDGNRMTFDDGGWQHWALAFEGRSYQRIKSDGEKQAGTWSMDPIAWCQARLAENHPVGLTWWSGTLPVGALPGYWDRLGNAYHAITLWKIDGNNLTITDSDDRIINGSRVVSYTFDGNDWTIQDTYWGVTAHVNYAVSLGTAAIPTLSEWGRIAFIIALIATTAWVFLWRRRAVRGKLT